MLHASGREIISNKDEQDMRVVVVGSGNVAESLVQGLKEGGLDVVQVFARNEARGTKLAEMVGSQWSHSELAEADLYIISVSDSAVAEVAASLSIPEGAVVAHTTGCCPMDALLPHEHRAVLYPFQTFSAGRKVDFTKGYIFLEGATDHALAVVEEVAHRLTDKVEMADGARRSVIHLSGVFSSNFVNAMYENATEVLSREGLSFDVIAPVIEETALKALASRNPRAVQTGPARRGDTPTLERHRAMLDGDDLKREIYDKISEDIWRKAEISKR